MVWGKPAQFIRTQFVTSDGKTHSSILLTSGFWGKSTCIAFFFKKKKINK